MSEQKVMVFCPSCGNKFNFFEQFSGRVTGGVSGATAGAILGAKIGIAMGPLGAIAGTIPGAILGSVFGKDFGEKYDNPECPSCKTKFALPSNLKKNVVEAIIGNEEISPNKNQSIPNTKRYINYWENPYDKYENPYDYYAVPIKVRRWADNEDYFRIAKYILKGCESGVDERDLYLAFELKDPELLRKVHQAEYQLCNEDISPWKKLFW